MWTSVGFPRGCSPDIHHGNGTEQILRKYNHPERILFWSSHIFFAVGEARGADRQDPHHDYEFYPGTGKSDFIEDNIFNQPLPPLWETEQCVWHSGLSSAAGGTTWRLAASSSAR